MSVSSIYEWLKSSAIHNSRKLFVGFCCVFSRFYSLFSRWIDKCAHFFVATIESNRKKTGIFPQFSRNSLYTYIISTVNNTINEFNDRKYERPFLIGGVIWFWFITNHLLSACFFSRFWEIFRPIFGHLISIV